MNKQLTISEVENGHAKFEVIWKGFKMELPKGPFSVLTSFSPIYLVPQMTHNVTQGLEPRFQRVFINAN